MRDSCQTGAVKVVKVASFSEDVVQSRNQNQQLPDNYRWVRREAWFCLLSGLLYGLAALVGAVYCKLFLHVTIRNREVLKTGRETGYFLYANHTQEIGDVLLPVLAVRPKRIYTIASTANLGIPVIGKLLPALGILPIPGSSMRQAKEFRSAVKTRIAEKKCVVVYPEAHVWPYYTGIRPFPATSFHYPVEENVPAFCMTTTYQKRKFGKKPGITVYMDGPFWPGESLMKKQRQQDLANQIYSCMSQRSQMSSYEYIHYEVGSQQNQNGSADR